MTRKDRNKRIEAAAKALADPPDRKIDWQPRYEDYSEEHKEALFRARARQALQAADEAVPVVSLGSYEYASHRWHDAGSAAVDRAIKAEARAKSLADALKQIQDAVWNERHEHGGYTGLSTEGVAYRIAMQALSDDLEPESPELQALLKDRAFLDAIRDRAYESEPSDLRTFIITITSRRSRH